MKIKITRTYRVESELDVTEVHDLNHLQMQIGLACEKQCHAAVDALRKTEGIKDAWCFGETEKQIIPDK